MVLILQEHPPRWSPALETPVRRQPLCCCLAAGSMRTAAGSPRARPQPTPCVDSRKPRPCRAWHHRVRGWWAQRQGVDVGRGAGAARGRRPDAALRASVYLWVSFSAALANHRLVPTALVGVCKAQRVFGNGALASETPSLPPDPHMFCLFCRWGSSARPIALAGNGSPGGPTFPAPG